MPYLIAYDIAHPRRLRRVARRLERHALRCQKSVFWYTGTLQSLHALLDELAALIDPDADVVQAWPVGATVPVEGFFCGQPRLAVGPALVVAGSFRRVVTPPPASAWPTDC
ncbi:MAG: CRISPR-associated endonuclease Cas2 [Gemmataceae bacterium]|nr:CRISPR-associated endonuclease Cas2 [Gemmata sp.]MDW8197513.1 CRISPR-associated endonuclease Cas2 [Gemmataceae bacterium]